MLPAAELKPAKDKKKKSSAKKKESKAKKADKKEATAPSSSLTALKDLPSLSGPKVTKKDPLDFDFDDLEDDTDKAYKPMESKYSKG